MAKTQIWNTKQELLFCNKIEAIVKLNKLSYLSTDEFKAFSALAIKELGLPARTFNRANFLNLFTMRGIKSPVRNHFKGLRHLTMATTGIIS